MDGVQVTISKDGWSITFSFVKKKVNIYIFEARVILKNDICTNNICLWTFSYVLPSANGVQLRWYYVVQTTFCFRKFNGSFGIEAVSLLKLVNYGMFVREFMVFGGDPNRELCEKNSGI
ncbi:hypothetical protein MTR_7g100338 [Medicago truncatula]|uniref:Uncharacterized protein n=1 Tax=Medicago truncatula TaxID=3880 RepID=A0A072U2T2_MEDTR|nr:hypothetical protein MTR_7g100338 [Medicago truncatula]